LQGAYLVIKFIEPVIIPLIITLSGNLNGLIIEVGRMTILEGFWEDITPTMKSRTFDGILFDSCPLDKQIELFQFFPFFREAYRLLKSDGVFTYFSDESRELSQQHRRSLREAGFRNLDYRVCKVKPAPGCTYWQHESIVVPIIRKR
jgi:predicted methyltransferase